MRKPKHYYFTPVYDFRPIWEEEGQKLQALRKRSMEQFSDMTQFKMCQTAPRLRDWVEIKAIK